MSQTQFYIGADIELEASLSDALERQGFVLIEDQATLARVGPTLQKIVPQRRRYWEEGQESGPFFFHHAQNGVTVGIALFEAAQLDNMAEADISVCSPDIWCIMRVIGQSEAHTREILTQDLVGRAVEVELKSDLLPVLGDLLNAYAPRTEGHWLTQSPPMPEDPTIQNYRLNQAWLKAEASKYAGEWIALYQGQLLAHGPQYREVRDEVARQGKLDHVLMIGV